MLDYLRISAPIAETQSNQVLSDAAKVVENFENPSVEEELSTCDEVSEAECRTIIITLHVLPITPMLSIQKAQKTAEVLS